MAEDAGYTCHRCGRTSHHPQDLEWGYCGACHDYTARDRPPTGAEAHVVVLVRGVGRICVWTFEHRADAEAKADERRAAIEADGDIATVSIGTTRLYKSYRPVSGPRLPGIGSHHSANPQTDEWLTPPYILEALGPFDLDPCSPANRPWPTAAVHYTAEDDGLSLPWHGRVFLNPPYSEITPWMAKLAGHGRGTALVFARCETAWWFDHVWPYAAALFLAGRVTFHRGDGTGSKAGHNSGGPSVLLAYGPDDVDRLRSCGLAGAFIEGAVVVDGATPPSPEAIFTAGYDDALTLDIGGPQDNGHD